MYACHVSLADGSMAWGSGVLVIAAETTFIVDVGLGFWCPRNRNSHCISA